MNHKKQIKQNAKFSGILFLFFVVFLTVFITICFVLVQYRASQNSPLIKIVGKTVNPCMVILAVSYDLEPVDVILISPSGEEYKEEYNAKHENNTMFISTITREKGDWIVKYNKKRNTQIHIKFEAKNVKKLLLEDLTWNLETKVPSVSFKGNFNGNESVSFYYDVILTSYAKQSSGTVCEGHAKTGDTITAKFNMQDIKKSDDWFAIINIYTTKNGDIEYNDSQKSQNFSYKPHQTKKTKKKGK